MSVWSVSRQVASNCLPLLLSKKTTTIHTIYIVFHHISCCCKSLKAYHYHCPTMKRVIIAYNNRKLHSQPLVLNHLEYISDERENTNKLFLLQSSVGFSSTLCTLPPPKPEECPALPVMLQNGLFLPNSEQPGTMVVTILNLQLLLGLAP